MVEEMEGLRRADAARRREVEALGAHLDCFRHALQGAAIGIELDVGDGVHVSKIGPKLTVSKTRNAKPVPSRIENRFYDVKNMLNS